VTGFGEEAPGPQWYPAPEHSTGPQWYPAFQPDSAPFTSDGVFTGARPPARRRGRLLLAVALTAAVGLVATVLAMAIPGGTRSAEAAVVASVNNAVSSKTAHADLTLNMNSGQITATGSGTLDFVNGSMDVSMDMSSVLQGLTIRVVYLAGKIYEQIPQITQLYPGKSWISLDLSGLANRPGGTGALNLGGNPAAMLRLLTQQGQTVTPVGSSDINGVPVKGYVVSIDPRFIQKQLGSANVPSWMRQAISSVSFQDATETVFIDGSGQLRRYTLHMGLSVPSSHQPSVTIDESLDLSNYGAPVSITAPPADQVVDLQQLLNDAPSQPSA
jgi:hypothetical protein